MMYNNYNNFDPLGQGNNYQQGGYNSYPPRPPKKKFSVGVIIASCLICSILTSVLTAGFVYSTFLIQNPSQNKVQGNSTTNITVEKGATNAVSAIAQKSVPSVVGIGVTASVNTFFGFSADTSSEGSGVIYSEDGYVITNYHVVDIAIDSETSQTAQISVFLSSDANSAIPATVVGYNSDYDLAVLKIDKTGLMPIEFADSNEVAVGDMAVAIGSPGGQQFMSSVSSGIISGLNRTIQLEGTAQMKLLQTDAAINPGNSGGALVDCYGKLIGINSSKISSEAFEGMGFAIPSNTVKKVVSNIINNKDKKYAYVGENNQDKVEQIINDLMLNKKDNSETNNNNNNTETNNEELYNIVLSHRPEYFEMYSEYDIDLLLSGHTHGGVVVLPFIGGIYAHPQGWFPKYTSGIYEKDNFKMIIGRGIGYSGIKLRIFNPPEINEIILDFTGK